MKKLISLIFCTLTVMTFTAEAFAVEDEKPIVIAEPDGATSAGDINKNIRTIQNEDKAEKAKREADEKISKAKAKAEAKKVKAKSRADEKAAEEKLDADTPKRSIGIQF